MDTDTSISQCCTTMVTYMKNSETIKSSLFNFKTDIIWYVVLQVALLHIIGIYGICTFNYLKNPMTTLWSKYPKNLIYIPTHKKPKKEVFKICHLNLNALYDLLKILYIFKAKL